jgi:putative ABC transport system permease protein
VLISEAMAHQYWPKRGAIGAQITIGKGIGPEFAEPARQIIGAVGDARHSGLDSDPSPIMYIPEAQVPDGVTALISHISSLEFAIRTKVPPFSLSADIQKALRDASGGLPVGRIESMDQIDAESTASTNFNMTLLTIFAARSLSPPSASMASWPIPSSNAHRKSAFALPSAPARKTSAAWSCSKG